MMPSPPTLLSEDQAMVKVLLVVRKVPRLEPPVVASKGEEVLAPLYKRRRSQQASVSIKVSVKDMVCPTGAVKTVAGHAQLLP